MAIVYGFGGLRLKEDGIHFAPTLPKQWNGYRFKINYEGSQIQVEVNREGTTFLLLDGEPKQIRIYEEICELKDRLRVENV